MLSNSFAPFNRTSVELKRAIFRATVTKRYTALNRTSVELKLTVSESTLSLSTSPLIEPVWN